MMRSALKGLRAWRPFNLLATAAVKAACGPWGGAPESVVRHLPRVGPAESRLPNGRTLRLWSLGDDGVANQVFWRGWRGYEPEMAPVFYELARGAGVVLDVGAHVGFYALLAAHANPSARVLAFEPLPSAAARLRRNVAENRLTNVEVFGCALGGEGGTARLFHGPEGAGGIPTSSGLSAEFFEQPYFAERGVAPATEVAVQTVDEVARGHGLERVDLIKIDTETTEPAVLAGARGVLERDRPDLIFEVLPGSGTAPAIEGLLAPLGYEFYLLRPEGPERRGRLEEHATLWNHLARAGRGRG
jgi:FkbM family methyltransferase